MINAIVDFFAASAGSGIVLLFTFLFLILMTLVRWVKAERVWSRRMPFLLLVIWTIGLTLGIVYGDGPNINWGGFLTLCCLSFLSFLLTVFSSGGFKEGVDKQFQEDYINDALKSNRKIVKKGKESDA